MKFIKVRNVIKDITSGTVRFKDAEGGDDVEIRRVHHRKTNWKLLHDGVYVHRDIVKAHNLWIDYEKA